MSNPYTDIKKGNLKIREFSHNIESDELVWHRDKRDRTVTVLEGEGWWFQMDDDIPREMKEGDVLKVPKETFHRIFKAGTSPLKIQIKESIIRSFGDFISEKKINSNYFL